MSHRLDVDSVESLSALAQGLGRYSRLWMIGLQRVAVVVGAAQERLDAQVEYWGGMIEQYETSIEIERAEYDSCCSDEDASCGHHLDNIAELEDELDVARHRLKLARRWRDEIDSSFREYLSKAQRLKSFLEVSLPDGQRFLGRLGAALDSYVTVAEPATNTSIVDQGSLGSGSAAVNLDEQARNATPRSTGASRGSQSRRLATVPVALFSPESTDFGAGELSLIARGLARLQKTVAPAVANGATPEFFTDLDRRQNLARSDGYRIVYDSYFGQSAIHVVFDGKNWSVDNGNHRIWAAQQVNSPLLPAKVTMPAADWARYQETGSLPVGRADG